ncbi:MAG: hypothetical protein DYG94_01855 [Leptolyngbya sp. PLA3]|nr:MAG: hypothetical protein EDM82_00025 [Cyanobacteria bacterium CYA]MCE7967477.1 hypothetical protein [Leptolyngbya sp. PL-A3]
MVEGRPACDGASHLFLLRTDAQFSAVAALAGLEDLDERFAGLPDGRAGRRRAGDIDADGDVDNAERGSTTATWKVLLTGSHMRVLPDAGPVPILRHRSESVARK